MKKLLSKLFTGSPDKSEIHDESIERLADILVSNYEARLRANARRSQQD